MSCYRLIIQWVTARPTRSPQICELSWRSSRKKNRQYSMPFWVAEQSWIYRNFDIDNNWFVNQQHTQCVRLIFPKYVTRELCKARAEYAFVHLLSYICKLSPNRSTYVPCLLLYVYDIYILITSGYRSICWRLRWLIHDANRKCNLFVEFSITSKDVDIHNFLSSLSKQI